MSQAAATDKKCREIIEAIVARCNTTGTIGFGCDLGGNSLTINDEKLGHTHVGDDVGTFEALVDQIHDQLTKGRGLSWA